MFSLRRVFWIGLTSLIVLGAIALISSVAADRCPAPARSTGGLQRLQSARLE